MEPRHQLRLRLRQIKRRPVRLRHRRDKENHKRRRHRPPIVKNEPKPLRLLIPHNLHHAQRPGRHHPAHQTQPHRQLITHQLRRTPQRPQQRIVAVRRPSPQHNPQDPHAPQRADHQQPHVHIGNPEPLGKRHHAKRHKRREHRHNRSDIEDPLIRLPRNNVFFQQQLQGIRQRLQ